MPLKDSKTSRPHRLTSDALFEIVKGLLVKEYTGENGRVESYEQEDREPRLRTAVALCALAAPMAEAEDLFEYKMELANKQIELEALNIAANIGGPSEEGGGGPTTH